MNQEQNNLNPNNFNTQRNNGVPSNKPLNNMNQNLQQNLNPKLPKKINFGLVFGIIAVVVAIGIGAFILLNNNDNKPTDNGNNNFNTEAENNNKSNNYINNNASDTNKLIMVLKKDDNQKYLIQFNEVDISKNFNCSNDRCGNEIINIDSISQIADNSISIKLNGRDYTISISKNISSYDRVIKENNNSYLYYNDLVSCYIYYFKISDSYIKIQPTNNNDICLNEEIALETLDYFNNNLSFMTVIVGENTKKIDFNSVKDANNSFIDITNSYFVNDFIFDYVSSLGFKINNPLDVNFYSNNKNRSIDLNLNYVVNKTNLEKINFEITSIDKSDFNNLKEKEVTSFNIGKKEIVYYVIDQSGVYMVINDNNSYFKVKATGTYFTNDTALNSLKEVLNELLKEDK